MLFNHSHVTYVLFGTMLQNRNRYGGSNVDLPSDPAEAEAFDPPVGRYALFDATDATWSVDRRQQKFRPRRVSDAGDRATRELIGTKLHGSPICRRF